MWNVKTGGETHLEITMVQTAAILATAHAHASRITNEKVKDI